MYFIPISCIYLVTHIGLHMWGVYMYVYTLYAHVHVKKESKDQLDLHMDVAFGLETQTLQSDQLYAHFNSAYLSSLFPHLRMEMCYLPHRSFYGY